MSQQQKTMTVEERIKLATECTRIVEKARRDLGHDLCGSSVLDLVADNIEGATLADLRDALFVAGLGPGVVR